MTSNNKLFQLWSIRALCHVLVFFFEGMTKIILTTISCSFFLGFHSSFMKRVMIMENSRVGCGPKWKASNWFQMEEFSNRSWWREVCKLQSSKMIWEGWAFWVMDVDERKGTYSLNYLGCGFPPRIPVANEALAWDSRSERCSNHGGDDWILGGRPYPICIYIFIQGGPLQVVSRVITPINGLITK